MAHPPWGRGMDKFRILVLTLLMVGMIVGTGMMVFGSRVKATAPLELLDRYKTDECLEERKVVDKKRGVVMDICITEEKDGLVRVSRPLLGRTQRHQPPHSNCLL